MYEPHEPRGPDSGRATFLGMFLAFVSTGFFFLVLILITGGFFFYVALVGGVLVALGFLHYLLWGRLLSQELSEQIGEEELERRVREEHTALDQTGFRR
jgi:hypothetical protein